MGDSVLVFDFGTTNFKAAIVDAEGRMSRVHRVPSPIEHPSEGRSEIPAERFIRAISDAIASLAAGRPNGLSDIGAISYASQANTFLLLDGSDRPLTPFIVWTDERASALSGQFADWAKDPSFVARSGLPVYGHLFSPVKMMWLAQEQPGAWKKMCRVSLLGDYFALWAAGQHVTDAGVAGLSGIFDVPNWRWMDEYCDQAGIPVDALPKVVRSGSILGTITPAFADAHGLRRDCRFVAGTLDQYAGAIGVGNASPDGCSETTGTVLAVVRCADHFAAHADKHVFRGPSADQQLFYHMSFGSVSANLLQHLQNQLPDRPSFESLDEAARADQRKLSLDPSGTPEQMMQQIRRWIGIQNVGDIVGCIYQTVAGALADHVDAVFGNNAAPGRIRSAGGAARSWKWLQVKANRVGCTMIAPSCDEPTLFGAAILASQGTGAPIIPAPPDDARCILPQKTP
jgi:xylulokinase